MAVHTLYSEFQRKSVMYCSTTGIAFGPLFDNIDAAEFVDTMLANGVDPRTLTPSDLATAIEDWEETFYALPDAL